MTTYCGAKKRSDGTPCKRPAGWGTDHAGTGRCKLHGGSSLKGVDNPNYKHGKYAEYLNETTRERIEAFDAHDPLALVDELNIQRALLADYLGRFKELNATAGDINMLMAWAAEIGRMVERIVKIRNDSALTAAEVKLLKARLLDVVPKYIDDPDKQRQFIIDLFGGDDEHAQRHPELIEAAASD
jgi:hypothetical protein